MGGGEGLGNLGNFAAGKDDGNSIQRNLHFHPFFFLIGGSMLNFFFIQFKFSMNLEFILC